MPQLPVAQDPGQRGTPPTTAATGGLVLSDRSSSLEDVYLTVIAENPAAVRACEKAGFRTIAPRRGSGYWYGRRAGELFMDAVPARPGSSPEDLGPLAH